MLKFFMMLLIFVFTSSGCHGCSFLQSKFGNQQNNNPQNQQENQEKKSEPIPINPQHS